MHVIQVERGPCIINGRVGPSLNGQPQMMLRQPAEGMRPGAPPRDVAHQWGIMRSVSCQAAGVLQLQDLQGIKNLCHCCKGVVCREAGAQAGGVPKLHNQFRHQSCV